MKRKKTITFAYAIIFILLFSPIQTDAREINVLYGELPPFMFIKNEKPAGFYYELLLEMKKEMIPFDFKIRHLPIKRVIHLTQKEPNTMCLGLTRNPKRENLYKWVGPSIPRRVGAYRLKSRPSLKLETEQDFKKYNFGVGLGYAAIQDLLKLGVPDDNIDQSPIDSVNAIKLFNNRIDFYASIDIVAVHNIKLRGYDWNDIHCEYVLNDKYHLYFAFSRKTDDAIISEFQQALDKVKTAGSWQRLVNVYYGKPDIAAVNRP